MPYSFLKFALSKHFGEPINNIRSVAGGCIAHASRVELSTKTVFVKWGDARVSQTFEAEAAGLRALAAVSCPLIIPKVYWCRPFTDAEPGILVLEWLETGKKGNRFWEDFGHALAEMHHCTRDRYGFDSNNYIGSTPQRNDWEDDWVTFFKRNRLQTQVDLARKNGRWRSSWDGALERLMGRIADLLPAKPPASILHGDLWSGNYLVTAGGQAALFDPAAYFGDRETDVAMTRLFGGFDARFYAAYHEAWPLAPGFEERARVYNLYHLLNHLNLFGGGYAAGVERALH